MKTFNIIKKARKYFSATTNGYPCKILIDSNSESLETGNQELEVDDISVRSKYGTDLIFKLSAPLAQQKTAGICTLQTPLYNKDMVEKCHNLGGKWDADAKSWIFSGIVSDKVDILDEKYNSDLIPVEITFTDDLWGSKGPAELCGFIIAKATGRDSGANLGYGISLISGRITSGGSMKNWGTAVKKDSIIRMEIPENCFDDFESNPYIAIKKI
jgi:hypothetical protein